MITKQLTWSALVSAAVSALAITSTAGIVFAADADATKERGRETPNRPAPETDYGKIDEGKIDEKRVQVQTDQAIERSSRALRELTKERGRDD